MTDKKRVLFRRVNGRIIPIAIGGAVTAAGGAIAAKKTGRTRGPDKFFKYGSYAAQVASGLVAAIPTKSALGLGLSLAGSVALDTAATAFNAKSVYNMKGSKLHKARVFSEQQAIGTGIGYGVFGSALLGRKDIRGKISGFVRRFSKSKNLPARI